MECPKVNEPTKVHFAYCRCQSIHFNELKNDYRKWDEVSNLGKMHRTFGMIKFVYMFRQLTQVKTDTFPIHNYRPRSCECVCVCIKTHSTEVVPSFGCNESKFNHRIKFCAAVK